MPSNIDPSLYQTIYSIPDLPQQMNAPDKAQCRSLYTPEPVYQLEDLPVLYESPNESQNLTPDVVSLPKSSNILENVSIKMKEREVENEEQFQQGYQSDQLQGLSKNPQDILNCELKESKLKSQPIVEHSTRFPSNPKEDPLSHPGTSQDPHVNTSKSDDENNTDNNNGSDDESTSSDSSSSSSDSSSEILEKSYKVDSNMAHKSFDDESSDSKKDKRQYKIRCKRYNKKVQRFVSLNMKLYFKQNPPPKRPGYSNVKRKHHKRRRTDTDR